MDEELQEDWLDAKLRDEAPYIDDAGFTARVVQQLPRGGLRSLRFTRNAILLAAAILASVLAFLLAGTSVANGFFYLVALPPRIIWPAAGLLALLLMVGGTSLAFSKARESRL